MGKLMLYEPAIQAIGIFALVFVSTLVAFWRITFFSTMIGFSVLSIAFALLMFVVYSVGRGGVNYVSSDLTGKVAIVTGGNAGIGKDTVALLAGMGCTVIMACRDPTRANKAAEEICKSLAKKAADKGAHATAQQVEALVQVMELDLASLKSVREFVEAFNKRELPLHFLVNNAGVMMTPYLHTEDKFEMQFGTNHLGHYLLTRLLMPNITKTAGRVICVASTGHELVPDKLTCEQLIAQPTAANYQRTLQYGLSKLANILMATELQRIFDTTGSRATAYSLHPGVVKTELSRHLLNNPVVLALLNPFLSLIMKSSVDGAQTSLFCCLSKNAVPGGYHQDCAVGVSTRNAKNGRLATELWEASEKMVGPC